MIVERSRIRHIPIQHVVAALLLALGMFLLNVYNLRGQSITTDEYAHLPAGYSHLLKGDFHLYPKNPPLIRMIEAFPLLAMRPNFPLEQFYRVKGGWAPWEYADTFVEKNRAEALKLWSSARVMNMLMGACLALLVFYWTSQLYGSWSGLLAMFLTATCPNILAHSGLATVDIGFALFFTLTFFFLWRLLEVMSLPYLIGAGVCFGAAQLSKFSGLIMIPILGVVMLAIFIRNIMPGESRESESFWKCTSELAAISVAILLIGALVINIGYRARGTLGVFKDEVAASSMFKKIATTTLGEWRVPLPGDYVHGLDTQLSDAERGEFPNYINGQWRQKGVWYYFLESIALKVTIPALILILLGMVIGMWRTLMKGRELRMIRPTIGPGQPAWPYVHLPAILFLAASSLFGNLQLGIRYVLPVLPMLFIAASRVVGSHWIDARGSVGIEKFYSRVAAVIVGILCLWQLTEVARATPHYISYFNEIAGGSKGWDRYLIDSNIDWGQDLPGLKKEMDRLGLNEIGLLYFGHVDPKLYGIKYHLPRPDDQFVAVSVNFLHGYPYALSYLHPWTMRPPMVTDSEYLEMFNFSQSMLTKKPAERIGGSINLYDLRGSVF